MIVVSTQEFKTNQDKYLDMALDEEVCIKKGDNVFSVQYLVPNNEPDVVCEPDEDFYRSITIDELRESAHKHIHKLFASQ